MKTVARTPPALAQWVHVDVDMCFSYIQLRANRIKNEGNFPDGFTLHLELGNVETCDQALLPFCELFKKGVASDQPAMSFKKQVKRLLLAMSNGSGVGNWLQNAGIHVSSEGLKDFENSQLLRTWKAETRKCHTVVSNRHPDLLHFYKSQNKWYPECSVTNALDERDERLGVDSLMQLAERVHDIPIASVERDGVVFWFKRESYNEANLMAQVRRVSQGLAFTVKALRNPVELARELCPTRGFKRVSGLDSIAFLDNWQVAKSAVGTNTFRETSHSFTLVLRDFYSHPLQERRRHSGALHHARVRPGEMPRVPPTPFNDDAWHSARREAILKGASRSESQPLDAQRRFKLLFPPAEDDPRSVAIYNFLTDETRPSQPGDRLYMRTNFPYKPFEVSEATERIVDNFMELYFNWHLVGSGEEEDGGEEVKRAVAKVLTCPDLEWFRGQWVTLEEDGAIKGSADKMLFIRKMDAKIFSRTDKFVGFVCITGPPGAGLAAMDEPIFDDRVRGAEDCKPVLAGLAGKAAGYCDEYPNRRINPETVKPLICARGGQVSARFGGAKEGQATSMEITATLIGAGNYPRNRRDGRQDLGSHPRVHFRERGTGFHFFKHVFLSFAFFDSKPRATRVFSQNLPLQGCETLPTHKRGNERYQALLCSGAFVPEYFWFMGKLFRFVNNDRIVKGRTWWPLPQALSVAPHLESVREEGSAVEGAVIEQLFQEVPRA